MSIEFSPETIKFEIEKQISKLQTEIDNSKKSLNNFQFVSIPDPVTYTDYRTINSRTGQRVAETKISNQNEISAAYQQNNSIQKQIQSINSDISTKNSTIKDLQDKLDLVTREIDVRNRQLETQSNMFSNSTLNSLKNINNEVIAQSMQNEDLRNKIIIGGAALGGLALFSGIIFKKKRSRK